MSILRERSRPRAPFPQLGAGLLAFATIILLFNIRAPFASATDLSSTNFIVRDPVSAGGGGLATSSSFQLWSSFSQNAQGRSTSASNELRAGFLYFGDAAASTPPPPPPPPPPPGGTGSGSQTTPTPPPAPVSGPVVVPPLISIILGEPLPQVCIHGGVSRSDFNCDGDVDLKDLSILLTRPKLVTGRVLSYLFSDWTRRLPVPGSGDRITVSPGRSSGRPSSPLAQVGEIVGSSDREPVVVPPEPKSFFGKIVGFFKAIGSAILRLFRF